MAETGTDFARIRLDVRKRIHREAEARPRDLLIGRLVTLPVGFRPDPQFNLAIGRKPDLGPFLGSTA